MVCASKAKPLLYKLLISSNRSAVRIDIFYEALNGNSIVLVGAILKDVDMLGRDYRMSPLQFRNVESVKEVENVEEDVVGSIC